MLKSKITPPSLPEDLPRLRINKIMLDTTGYINKILLDTMGIHYLLLFPPITYCFCFHIFWKTKEKQLAFNRPYYSGYTKNIAKNS